MELNFDQKNQIPSPRPRTTQDVATITEVGERSPVPPKKPPRTFLNKSHTHSSDEHFSNVILQRTLSVSSTQSNTESFTNVKHPSLDSIDELTSLRHVNSNSESCFNSHYQQMQNSIFFSTSSRSKSISPHTPQSPQGGGGVPNLNSPHSPFLGHQPAYSSSANDFLNDEFYIDESLPSSLSIETGHSQGDYIVKQLDTANSVVALLQVSIILYYNRSMYVSFAFRLFFYLFSLAHFLLFMNCSKQQDNLNSVLKTT